MKENDMQTEKTFNDLVSQFLGRLLPDELAAPVCMQNLMPEARGFILRMLNLMKHSGYTVNDFNPPLIHWLSATVPSILPGAWGGRIPPLTLPGRHKRLDALVAAMDFDSAKEPNRYLDVGCGFPPVTSAETAKKLSGWHIYAVDRSFADYVVYDADGHYACFDQKGEFLYFQAFLNVSGRILYGDPKAARRHFMNIFEDLFPLLENASEALSITVEKAGNRLIHNHIRDFESENLTMTAADFLDLSLPPVKVIRCMNVLVYFESDSKKAMLGKAGELLDHDGVMIAGTNGLGIQSRYVVYRKGENGMEPEEFAFGLDNVGHIIFMPFFSIHENDPEAGLLAEIAGIIRSDSGFWPEFSLRQDDLLREHGVCKRKSDGFLHFEETGMSPDAYLKLNALIWQKLEQEGFVEGAVDALVKRGYSASKNAVGDITIRSNRDFELNTALA